MYAILLYRHTTHIPTNRLHCYTCIARDADVLLFTKEGYPDNPCYNGRYPAADRTTGYKSYNKKCPYLECYTFIEIYLSHDSYRDVQSFRDIKAMQVSMQRKAYVFIYIYIYI